MEQPFYLKKNPVNHWCYLPNWIRAEPLQHLTSLNFASLNCWVLTNYLPFSSVIFDFLSAKKIETQVLEFFSGNSDGAIDPINQMVSLLSHAMQKNSLPNHIFLVLGDSPDPKNINFLFHLITKLIQWMANNLSEIECTLSIITYGIFNVLGTETVSLEKSLLIGPAKVLGKEIDNFRCNLIDVEISQNQNIQNHLLSTVVLDIFSEPRSFEAAYRGKYRWIQKYQQTIISQSSNTEHSLLKKGGTYLIIGGTGGIGSKIGEYLGINWNAKLVLMARQGIFDPETHSSSSKKMKKSIQHLRDQGIDFDVIEGDVTNFDQLQKNFKAYYDAGKRFDGIIHAAGIAGGGFIQLRNHEQFNAVLNPKVVGILNLEKLLTAYPSDFLVSFSSLTSILGEIGQADYCSANCFLDAATARIQKTLGVRSIAINWARWDGIGMAQMIKSTPGMTDLPQEHSWISPEQGVAIFEDLLSTDLRQIIVSPYDLDALERLQESDPLAWFSH